MGLAGVVLSYVFYLRGRREKKPTYAVRAVTLVQNLASRYPGVEMRFKDRPVENLTVARIAFWNDGRETIAAEDLAPADPTMIKLTGEAEMLEAKMIFFTSKASQISVEQSDSGELRVHFDYLDNYQGGILQLFHTGTDGDDVKLLGSVKGAGNWQRRYRRSDSSFARLAALLGGGTILSAFGLGELFSWHPGLIQVSVFLASMVALWVPIIFIEPRWLGEVPAEFNMFRKGAFSQGVADDRA